MSRKLLVTGSNGLIGSEVVVHFCNEGWDVTGFDNNMRADFFGPKGDTRWNQSRLEGRFKNFRHVEMDIRDRERGLGAGGSIPPDAIVHTAPQPSHALSR